jgi:hypothetical protein
MSGRHDGSAFFNQPKIRNMKQFSKFTVATLFAVLCGIAGAQTAAGGTAPTKAQAASTDPIVKARADERAARKVYNDKVAAAKKARDAKVKVAVDQAEADAKAQGKDPLVAKRDAKKKATEAAKPEYDAVVKAAKQERDAAVAAAKKQASAAAPKR